MDEDLQDLCSVFYLPCEGENCFSASDHILLNLPEELNVEYITEQKTKLKKQLIVVSKRMSDLILANQKSYSEELQRVTDLQNCLSDTIKMTTKARKTMDVVKQSLSVTSISMIASYKRREILKSLLNSLLTIKTLQETDIRLRELIDDDRNYSKAIQLCLECQNVVNNLKHYKCVSEFSTKLMDTIEMTEELIDATLAKMCTAFNEETYSKLQNAYKLLGKTQPSIDQLLMHFASAIYDKAFAIVLGYVELCTSTGTNFKKMSYNELCSFVNSECFIPCFTSLNKALWHILLNYKRILNWHYSNDVEEVASNSCETDGEESSESLNRKYEIQKLEHGSARIWQEVQQKLKILLVNHELHEYSFDEFLAVLSTARRMIDIGIEFCGNKSDELEETLRRQSVNYFKHYHRVRMEEFKMFLENEIWQICPVKLNFEFKHLQEFQFLREQYKYNYGIHSPLNSPEKQSSYTFFTNERLVNINSTWTPFHSIQAPDENNANHSEECNDDELKNDVYIADVNEESKRNSIDLNEKHTTDEGHIATNTTLSVLRLIGKYMQIMCILNPISFDVLLCIFQLFDYYFYTVFKLFGEEITKLSDSCLSSKLKSALSRINDSLILRNSNRSDASKFEAPVLSSMVQLFSKERLSGLPERAIGVESLIFLANKFIDLETHLKSVIQKDKQPYLERYISQTVNVTEDLRSPVYMLVAAKSIDYENILSSMTLVRWDVKEIMSQHNTYVDVLLRELQIFALRLNECNEIISVRLPKEAITIIWEQTLKLANRTFVEGFANAKQCTPEGRALMQLDYQQFLTKVEAIASIKPIPERELVEEYIKAYYLRESALEQWIKNKTEYTNKQLIALINLVTSDNKRSRMRLIKVIESDQEVNTPTKK